ncbi:MAG: nuclease [Bryobacteraceae bacterium]
MNQRLCCLLCLEFLLTQPLAAWGLRGHTVANLAAVEAIPADGPAFLRLHKAYIGHLGTIPDTWRSPADPFLRISEDPNHGWYTEEFDFVKDIPRSRTEFTLKVYDEYLRVRKQSSEKARLLNIRYTGLQAYSAMEGYERMKAGMRLYRLGGTPAEGRVFSNLAARYGAISPLFTGKERVQSLLATDIAFYMGWLGHYIADAAQPLHNSRHHDGWSGDNLKGYTRDPEIHGRFESTYVDLIQTSEPDVARFVRKEAKYLEDPWTAILDHMIEARDSVEDVYRVDLRRGFTNASDKEAQELVYRRLASGASFLRDLAYTAWIESAKPVPPVSPLDVPNNPNNPRYNPATGSAPAPLSSKN